MSVSKLESLPNEILTDILENYMNAIDVVNAFAFQLNQRFDALITQSHRLRFNFIRSHKDDFRTCMGLLPAYIDKIGQLTLAERYTPGQVHAFLSFYPSFDVFKHLRKLYFHADAKTVDKRVLTSALTSLLKIDLHTLSLDITGTEGWFSFEFIIIEIFRVKTLKKCLLSCDNRRVDWDRLKRISSNIGCLTIHGIICRLDDLAHILRCASNLRYLDISLQFVTYYGTDEIDSSANNIPPPMPMLHTLILNLVDNDQTMFSQLDMYFQRMPSLYRLEIRTQNGIWSIGTWETLIQSSIPSLTSFMLEDTTTRLTDKDVSSVLESTKASFWTSKPNFHVIIKELPSSNHNLFSSEISDRYRTNETITRWFIGPQRMLDKYSSVLNGLSKLRLSAQAHSLSQNHYLNNVIHLIVADLTDDLLQLLPTCINCSRIQYLDVSSITTNNNNNIISSLLSLIPNLRSLRIHFERLYENIVRDGKSYDHLRTLDISAGEHELHKRDIQTIRQFSPHLEHLSIYTRFLENVPLLQTYFPHLRTLTFRIIELTNTYFYNEHEQKLIDSILHDQVQFHFQREESRVTVWIDQEAFQDPYWQQNGSTDTSGHYNDRSRLKRIIDEMYFDWN